MNSRNEKAENQIEETESQIEKDESQSEEAESQFEDTDSKTEKAESQIEEEAEEEDDDEDDDEDEEALPLWKIILSAVLLAAGLAVEHLPFFQSEGNETLQLISKIAYLVLYFGAFILCGLGVVKEAVENLFKGKIFDEEFLMAIASIGAICLGECAEAVAVMLLFQIGEFFEDKAVDKSKDSIKELMNIRPDKAVVIRNGSEATVDPATVEIGEIILLKPGERAALDGTVVKGKSFVDTSALTGESVPREIGEGSEILAGFVNTSGTIEFKVTKLYGESAASRVLELVQNAQSKKAKSEQFITKFSRVYTPAVCAAAVLTAVIPPLFIPGQIFSTWIYRALMFLVVSCPCALVISVPLSFFAGIGSASRKGILIKGASYLEKLSKADTVVFDKTGTLTKGVFAVTGIHSADPSKFSEEEILSIATHAEYYSNHPISRSLKDAHHCDKCENVTLDDAEEISGQGIIVTLDGKKILAGNMRLMMNNSVTGISECEKDDTGTIIHLAIDGVYAGHIVISDEVKEDSKQAIEALHKTGVSKTVLLTGDSESAAEKTGRILNIDKVFSQLLPGDKVTQLEKLIEEQKDSGKTVAFVGDGINDAPVITRADVGIAMGALGSDAAIEAADVVLMDDKPSKVGEAVRHSKATMRIVWENIIFSLAVKLLIMILSTAGITNMWTAVFGDVGVTIIAILNAMRMLAVK